MEDWGIWIHQNMSDDDRTVVVRYLREKRHGDNRMVVPQADGDLDAIQKWQTQFTAALREHLTEVLMSQVEGLPEFNDEQQRTGAAILDRTMDWVQTNLWVAN